MSEGLSVQDRKKLFEKGSSPTNSTTTSPTNGINSGSKMAELRARLDRTSPSNASTPSTSNAKSVVPRTSSASKLDTSVGSIGEAKTPQVGTVARSTSSSKLDTSIVTVGEAKTPQVGNIARSGSSSKLDTTVESAESEVKVLEETSSQRVLTKASSASDVLGSPSIVEALPATTLKAAPLKKPAIIKSSSTGNLSEASLPTPPALPAALMATLEQDPPMKALSVDSNAEAPAQPVATKSPASRFYIAADMRIPPTVEQQDFYVLWGLSFVVPFFLLRFVFELVRKTVLGPARMAVRHAPGGSKLLSWLYVKLGPVAVKATRHMKERLPPMDSINTAAKAGLEKFLATLQTAAGAAYPHLLHLAESIKTMRFKEAAVETMAVLKAWAPMLLLLIPLTKNAVVAGRQGLLVFWRVSKTAFYLPFGGFLKRAVQQTGKALAENPDVFAERVAGLLGPIVGFIVSLLVLIRIGIAIGVVDYHMLSSLYVAWFFELLGMVSEPSVLDQHSGRGGEDALSAGGMAASAAASVIDSVSHAAAAASGANAADGATGGSGQAAGGGWSW